MKIEIVADQSGEYRWQLIAANGKAAASSGESFARRGNAIRAAEYHSMMVRSMPHYEEMLEELVRCLPGKATSVLELGCGTGNLTVLLARKYSGATVIAVDGAADRIEVAQDRLSGRSGRQGNVEFVVSMFEEFSGLEGTYDVVASSFSFGHILDRAQLYAKLRKMMAPSGLLAIGDELAAEPPQIEELHRADWIEFAIRPGHLTAEELADALRHDSELHHYPTLRMQMEMLQAAGFHYMDCVWRWRNYAVIVAEA